MQKMYVEDILYNSCYTLNKIKEDRKCNRYWQPLNKLNKRYGKQYRFDRLDYYMCQLGKDYNRCYQLGYKKILKHIYHKLPSNHMFSNILQGMADILMKYPHKFPKDKQVNIYHHTHTQNEGIQNNMQSHIGISQQCKIDNDQQKYHHKQYKGQNNSHIRLLIIWDKNQVDIQIGIY